MNFNYETSINNQEINDLMTVENENSGQWNMDEFVFDLQKQFNKCSGKKKKRKKKKKKYDKLKRKISKLEKNINAREKDTHSEMFDQNKIDKISYQHKLDIMELRYQNKLLYALVCMDDPKNRERFKEQLIKQNLQQPILEEYQ